MSEGVCYNCIYYKGMENDWVICDRIVRCYVRKDRCDYFKPINTWGQIMTKENVHSNCENYSPKRDYCLKWFEENVREKYETCKEYSEFNDSNLQRKWSN